MKTRTKIRPTVPLARKTLHRAFKELAQARDDEGLKQAAEKAWRAAREGVYAVLIAGGESPRGTVGGADVRHFEATRLAGYDTSIADGYSTAQSVLHGECFYDGAYTIDDREIVRQTMDRVKVLLDDCITALSILRSG